MLVIDRFYRDFTSTKRWATYRVKVESSDLYIRTKDEYSSFVKKKLIKLRKDIEAEIRRCPAFLTSFEPILPKFHNIPEVVKIMYRASEKAGVGPMASVAGAIAHIIGEELSKKSEEVIVENGGDIFINVKKRGEDDCFCRRFSIFRKDWSKNFS